MEAKMLADLGGAPLVVRTCENLRSSGVFTDVYVAVDHAAVQAAVEGAGFTAVLTDPELPSGTDRVAKAAELLRLGADTLILNAQGDEPFVGGAVFARMAEALRGAGDAIVTACERLSTEAVLLDHNAVKVAIGENQRALYFSRSPIPHVRDARAADAGPMSHHFRHLGIYGYRLSVLRKLTRLPVHALERLEALEQLRWLAHGYPIRCVEAPSSERGVDTTFDLDRARTYYRSTADGSSPKIRNESGAA